MRILLACMAGFILDMIFGDPVWLYHPVRIIGHLITLTERCLRKLAGTSKRALLSAGVILWLIMAGLTTGSAYLVLRSAYYIHPAVGFAGEIFCCYQLLAMKSLKQESMKVHRELEQGDLTGARRAVAMIVGRDTEKLNREGVIKAAVETVAENTSDGVIAPLFYMLIGGVPLVFLYKAVNTMDSMVGYKNESYLYFGRAAAKLDDVFNYLPARISALLMTAAAFCLRLDGERAWQTWLRDRRNHASPNAAQTEAVCAGALGIQLAGNACYFGKLYEKSTIGEARRQAEAQDIVRLCRLMYLTAVFMLVIGSGIRLLCIVIFTLP